MIYVGIDPGLSGGIAAVSDLGVPLLHAKMPATDADLLALLRANWGGWGGSEVALQQMRGRWRCCVELVHSSPQMGVRSAFTFGRGFGAILMALAAVKLPYDLVSPAKWQTAMQCRSKGDKNVTKRRAQQLFPDVTITHAIADALLIAEYGRRVYEVSDHGKKEREEEAGQRGGTARLQEALERFGVAEEEDEHARTLGGIILPSVTPVPAAARDGAGPQRPARSHLRKHPR